MTRSIAVTTYSVAVDVVIRFVTSRTAGDG